MLKQTKILGFIGIGLMGEPMTKRFLMAGYQVNVWNRSQNKLAGVKKAGAIACDSIQTLVLNSDIVLLCVSDTQAVESIVFGEKGITHALSASSKSALKIIVDFSSIDPDCTRAMARKLDTKHGIKWVDSPVSGGVSGAEQGTLAIMCGGDAQVIGAINPVLKTISKRITRMGSVGSGQATKICNQMIVCCNVLVMAEAIALAEKFGVDPTKIPDALKGGFADSLPLQLTGPKMANRDYDEIKWHVRTLVKDLDMANHHAKSMKSATPLSSLGAELMHKHAQKGFMDKDPATLIEEYSDKTHQV